MLVASSVPVTALLVACLAQARDHPDVAPGGGADAALALQFVAGLALVVGALRVEPAVAAALLAAATGLALHALPAPPDGALLFTLGLIGAGLAPAAVAHAALAYPGGRLTGSRDRVAVTIGYLVRVGLMGVLVAAVLDPRARGCFACPRNLLLIHGDPEAADWLGHWAPRAGAVVDLALAALVALRLARWPPAARSVAGPVSAAALAVLVLSAVTDLRAAGTLAPGATDRDLWLATVATLGLVALGLAWRPMRAGRVRAALGRLTVAATAGPDDLRTALAQACGDPDLSIVVPHPETGVPLTLDAAPAPPPRARTAVERQGRLVAWLDHDPDTAVLPEITRPAALTLERDALLASQRLQEAEVRASTARLVEAGDAERRRLERDLHDGAQQRLLALGLALERARAGAPPADSAALDDARERIAALRDDVRRIAHGIHSVTLAEGGLAEAVLALVQAAPGNVTVDALPDRRASAAAEAAVYRLVAACLPLGREAGARVAIHTADAELHAIIIIADATAGALTDALAHAGARIAALGGSLTVAGAEGQATANARVPAIP
jgi:signal transduction histidine kinase